jgi:hypothetical protein
VRVNPLHYPKIVKLRVEKRLTKRFGGLFALSFKLPSDCSSSFQGEVFLLRMWIVAITTAKVIAPITVPDQVAQEGLETRVRVEGSLTVGVYE